jgi:hypothetical protein
VEGVDLEKRIPTLLSLFLPFQCQLLHREPFTLHREPYNSTETRESDYPCGHMHMCKKTGFCTSARSKPIIIERVVSEIINTISIAKFTKGNRGHIIQGALTFVVGVHSTACPL